MLPRVAAPCRGCGLAQPVAVCPRRASAWSVARVTAPFDYAPPLEGYLHALKFRRERSLGRAFGLLLAAELARTPRTFDTLVPVPLSARRLRARGYNQAAEIARAAARALGVPVLLSGAARTDGAPQTGLTAAARRRNVATAFRARGVLTGRRIAVVDDVITTGATVNALARVLLAAGAAEVEAVAVARTPARVGEV